MIRLRIYNGCGCQRSLNWENLKMKLRASILAIAAAVAITPILSAQMQAGKTDKPLLSPPAKASVELSHSHISIAYSAPSMRNRKIMGALVPYDKVWRTGANAATTLTTDATVTIGSATVPAGTYTLYSLPSQSTWKLIINKQTGQWGTEYDPARDLARVEMKTNPLPTAQETMSISFEDTHGSQTQLHIRWENTDVSVPVAAQ